MKNKTQKYFQVRQSGDKETAECDSGHMSGKQEGQNLPVNSIVNFPSNNDKTDEEPDWRHVWRYVEIFVAEFIGTGLLMFVGCMSTVQGLSPSPVPVLQPGLAFGMVVATLIQIFGHISSAHLNPAVTICFYMLGRVSSLMHLITYIVAEILGATAGILLLKAVGVEVIATSCLVFLVCALTDPRNSDNQDSAPIKFGLYIAAISFAAGPYTGASMNPARSLAPAIASNNWNGHWIYWLGPMSAGFIIPLLYKFVFCKNVDR